MNDRSAKLLVSKEIYPNGANSPTMHYEYECPCGKGRIIDERVVGFRDYYAYINCPVCKDKYEIRSGWGYIRELVAK